jgi:capsular exopolysaccharide synthesis family protein
VFDVARLYEAFVRQKWVILLTVVAVAGVVGGYTLTLSPVYRASSLVRVETQTEGYGGVVTREVSNAQATRTASGEVGMLRHSVELARRVEKRLRQGQSESGPPLPILGDSPDRSGGSENTVARRLLQTVQFVPRSGENMIEIVVESTVPEEASTVANVYAQTYKSFSREKARESIAAARAFLEERAAEQQEKVRQLEAQWTAFARDNRLPADGEDGEGLVSQYNALKARRDRLRFDLESERMQLDLLRQQLDRVRPQLEQSVLQRQEASELKSEIQALETRIADLRAEAAQYYAANPNLEGDTTRIQRQFPELASLVERADALASRKRGLTRRLIETASSGAGGGGGGTAPIERIAALQDRITEKEFEARQLESQITALDSQIARYESRLNSIPKQQVERDQIQRRLKQAESFHQSIVDELQKMSVAEESELGYVEVVRSATLPSVPVRPDMTQNLILGVLLGLGFGLGIALLREATSTQLRRPEDIEERGYDLLGVVPDMGPDVDRAFDGDEFVTVDDRSISTRLMPLLHPWSSTTENYRMIRMQLWRGREKTPKTFIVTSAQQKEGKTTTAVNLALTEALSGNRVLLIDADLRRPTVHTVVGIQRAPGLADMLRGIPDANARRNGATETSAVNFDGCIHRSLVDGLFVVPAGFADAPPTELLDSNRIQHVTDAAQEYFDVVIIDTPPTLPVSDAVVIGAQTEAAAIVVTRDQGDRRALDTVMKSLRSTDVPVAGVVLNHYDESNERYGDGYHYSYYGSDAYADYTPEDVPRRPPRPLSD